MNKNTIKLISSFSLSMVSGEDIPFIRMREISIEDLQDDLAWCDLVSHVSVPELATVLTHYLNRPIEVNRSAVRLKGNRLIVAKVYGGRLEAGMTQLPGGMILRLVEVYLNKPNLVRFPAAQASEMPAWPVEHIHPEEPTTIGIDWENGEITIMTVSKTLNGDFAAFVQSRTGHENDCYIVDCGEQTWQSVINKEMEA